MNKLSYLEKLLDGVEVEWRTLGEIAVIYDGTHKTPKYTASGVPFVSVQNIKNLYGTNKYISPEDFKTYKNKPRKHDLFMTRIGDVGTCAIVEDDRPLAYYVTLALIRINQQIAVPGFIRYLIESRFGKAELYKRTLIHAVPMKINLGEIGKVAVPIPCPDNPEKSLAIQSEIVRILDKFTALTAELTAELTARKKQYNYYRDQLLGFEDGEVEWVVLGNLVDINTGSKPPEIYEKATDYDYINAGTSRSGYSDESNCEGDTVTTPSRGQGGIGYVGYQKKPFWLGPLCYKFRAIDEELLVNKYLFYFLQSRNELLLSLKKEGGVPAINKSDLVRLEVPVPPLVKQQKIVDVLDNFYTLITSITEGLPREIELRQKQYEYYRDLLFSFPKPDSVTN
ncbi:Restriction modification system DNA specificity domain protein [Klebsiella pneumoniae]|uniref:restriction endonuclease subunit S n=1 Tax=Klebsiella pneumoniae TaxID=573 RepID=UPI000808F19F|nr:restriction endonuclease subunit S [Klebsiella pneumoniae]SBZ73854.1 Restriction modification system DNA specificity domain protein [Klebsiella pneumoniae]SSH31032.1 Restriction modification system DNA specificity domain protein [Klebsiella pneumoniae]